MQELPERKQNRIENYDYATCGAYFVTICTANREKMFWSSCRGELCSPEDVELSAMGMIVNQEIRRLDGIYMAVRVDKYCIMPDHIHMILSIEADADGRTQVSPYDKSGSQAV